MSDFSDVQSSYVQANYSKTAQALALACDRAGRSAADVKLLAVSKTVGVSEVHQAALAGAMDFGENRPDQLLLKADALPQYNWHFIGNIQSRRIKDIVGRAALIHSLFDMSHAKKIDEVAAYMNITQSVLLEVNVSGEASKSGISPAELKETLKQVQEFSHVRVCGLMTMAPQGDPGLARKTFCGLRELFEELRVDMNPKQASYFCELSMGMSEDWPIAIEEGATIIRIGRAIFSSEF